MTTKQSRPAGPIYSGRRQGGPLSLGAPYTWAKRTVNWWALDGRQDIVLNVSRSEDSERGGVSAALFFGDEDALEDPGGQMTENELRDLLAAAGFAWARREE